MKFKSYKTVTKRLQNGYTNVTKRIFNKLRKQFEKKSSSSLQIYYNKTKVFKITFTLYQTKTLHNKIKCKIF